MIKRKRGGQPGNTNAVGNRGGGAPKGNTNALKHGGYAAIRHLSDHEREIVAGLSTDCRELLLDEIRLFTVRERRLMHMIAWAKSADGGLLESVTTRKEEVREFPCDEDRQRYEATRLPGRSYMFTTEMENAETVILRLEECLTRCQRQKQKAIDLWAELDTEAAPAALSGFASMVVADLMEKKKGPQL